MNELTMFMNLAQERENYVKVMRFLIGYCVLLIEYCCFSVIQVSLLFSESGRHQFLPISHSRAMTEPVVRDVVVVFVTPPASQWFAYCFL